MTLAELSTQDSAAIVDAAEHLGAAAVALLLDLGFAVAARRAEDGATAVHAAAYAGRADVVRLLIDRGADVNARDERFDSTPLSWATVGSGQPSQFGPGTDWVATVAALFDAGAEPDGAWTSGRPPSAEVAALLLAYGIAGEDDD